MIGSKVRAVGLERYEVPDAAPSFVVDLKAFTAVISPARIEDLL